MSLKHIQNGIGREFGACVCNAHQNVAAVRLVHVCVSALAARRRMCGSWERINSCIENLSSLANALGQISVRCFMNVPATIARISALVRIVFLFTSYCNLSVFLRPSHISISSSSGQYMRPPYPIYLSAFIQTNYRKWMHVLLFTRIRPLAARTNTYTLIETKHSSAAERRLL